MFVWTFVFAASVVFFSFALGLFLAITLDKKGLRFQRLYRSALDHPVGDPGFLALLVWAGLLNDDFGVVNKLFRHPRAVAVRRRTGRRVSVVLVSVWLTTPYFFLVSLGALQSIPGELTEAARVDGGGAWQIFRRVTLPLLLVAVAPLMIASFAFNFNNFNNIYLLTGGGPYTGDIVDRGLDGHPDQLHVQARDRDRQGRGLRRSRARSRSSSSSSSRRSRASRSARTKALENMAMSDAPSQSSTSAVPPPTSGAASRAARRAARVRRTTGGGTSSR